MWKYLERPDRRTLNIDLKGNYAAMDAKRLTNAEIMATFNKPTQKLSNYITIDDDKPNTLATSSVEESKVVDPTEICLREHQLPHVARLKEIYTRSSAALDTSALGSGKTITHLFMAIFLNIPIIVICPTNNVNDWMLGIKQYNVPFVRTPGMYEEEPLILTYGRLALRSNPLLMPDTSNSGLDFKPTPFYERIMKTGVYLVFDESQKLKNEKSATSRGGLGLVSGIFSSFSKSRVAFLSATPFDKLAHIDVMINLLGLSSPDKEGKDTIKDLETILSKIKVVDRSPTLKNKVDGLLESFSGSNAEEKRKTIELFFQIIGSVTSRMELKIKGCKCDIKMGCYKMKPDELKKYSAAVAKLEEDSKGNSFSGAMQSLELTKVSIVVRLAFDAWCKGFKVIMFANYHSVLDALEKEFKDLKVLRIDGTVPKAEIAKRIALFQEPSKVHRFMICNLASASTGISLHDTTGEHPRVSLILPNYAAINQLQATGRTFRSGSVGTSYVRFIYGTAGILERKIIMSLSKKSDVLEQAIGAKVKSFADYPIFFEETAVKPDKFVQF